MPDKKSPDNDGLCKEFYKTFWEEIKDVFKPTQKVVSVYQKNKQL